MMKELVALLKSSVKDWNKLVSKQPEASFDLCTANLKRENLEGVNFENVGLWAANLSFANLKGTNLRNAGLRGASLRDARLSNSNLTWADLENANLSYAFMSGCDIRYATLKGANVYGTEISCVYLPGMVYHGALYASRLNPAKMLMFHLYEFYGNQEDLVAWLDDNIESENKRTLYHLAMAAIIQSEQA